MIVWVTGANGFIGRHLALAMARSGHEVVALVRSSRMEPDTSTAALAPSVKLPRLASGWALKLYRGGS